MAVRQINYNDMVFVFGSNLNGVHGNGAADFAVRFRGAVRGRGVGPMGQSYALPVKREPYDSLGLDDISAYVRDFISYAQSQRQTQFLVTRIGCGYRGLPDETMARMFEQAPTNCHLPGKWVNILKPGTVRLAVVGSRDLPADLAEEAGQWLDRKMSRLMATPESRIEAVCGAQVGGDAVGYQWAARRGLDVAVLAPPMTAPEPGRPPRWRYGKATGFVRNSAMAWYATHVAALWDGSSHGTKMMLKLARESDLTLPQKHFERRYAGGAVASYPTRSGRFEPDLISEASS